jgi:sRNA-binding regulator protein Hfq
MAIRQIKKIDLYNFLENYFLVNCCNHSFTKPEIAISIDSVSVKVTIKVCNTLKLDRAVEDFDCILIDLNSEKTSTLSHLTSITHLKYAYTDSSNITDNMFISVIFAHEYDIK